MPKIVENETYLDTREVLATLEVSKQMFYSNARPLLKVYRFDARKTPWYKERDILALKSGKLTRKANINLIGGIQRDWTTTLRAMGYHASTVDRTIEITTLPADAIGTFNLPADKKFVKRSRMTFADQVPICAWDTYYPLEIVDGKILEEMKHSYELDVVKRIKEEHGITVGWARERDMARTATIDEQELLQLLTNDPVLILQRASYTGDKKILVLYSDMVLLGSWFAPEREYEVHTWDD